MDAAKGYIIRNMTPDEIGNIAVEWAALEGWNPGLHDAACFGAVDPNGFLVGLLNNQPIACISAVSYHSRFGFMGFYIVKPEYRGQGYGIKIWDAAIQYLKNQNIGLDGVVEQQDNYRKSGFKLAYSNIRYEGITQSLTAAFDGIVPLTPTLFEAVSNYDRLCFPEERSDFLRCWVQQPESYALVATEQNEIKGYGVIRKCRNGYKIGPLFANNAILADQLMLSLSDWAVPGERLYLDVPEPNTDAVQLAEKYCMKKAFGTARMYTQQKPDIRLEKVFGVTSFELG